ncbi:MAG: tetratricopeptide repeat protein [bacterium]
MRNCRLPIVDCRFPGVLLLLAVSALASAGPAEQFARANAAYEAQDYAGAVVLYDSALEVHNSAAAYYNRGNAHFKLGQVGRAIADYNRSFAAAPLDEGVRHNLEFARQFRADKSLVLQNPLARGLAAFLRLLPAATARLLAGVFFLFALLALAEMLVHGRRFLGWVSVGLGAVFLYLLAATLSWSAFTNPARSVVVAPELTLRSGPGAEYKDIAVVHDGLEVVVRERRPGFVLVQLPGGEGGWAESGAVEQVFGR